MTWQLTITQLDESMDVGLSVCKISCLPIRVKAEVCLLSDDPLCEAEQGACSKFFHVPPPRARLRRMPLVELAELSGQVKRCVVAQPDPRMQRSPQAPRPARP